MAALSEQAQWHAEYRVQVVESTMPVHNGRLRDLIFAPPVSIPTL